MLKRRAEEKLESWKRRSRGHALLVTGARQVGKSFLVSAFAEKKYSSVVSFDLIDDDRALRSFRRATSADDLFMRISLLAKRGIGELDALFERADGTVVAVEVKSGGGYRTHRAIDNALATEHYGIDEAYVAAEANIERDGRVLYVPAYLLGMVAEG